MKSIIGRFGELKKNIAGTALSEYEDLDYNKVDTALKSVGVSLKTADGQFRDLDDVLLELSSKWDSLSRNEQRYVATVAAGSRQQSRLLALMSDYQRTLELVEVAQDSAGRSSEQFAKYQDTIEMKIKRLSNTWEQFRVQIANSNIFKNVIDRANEALTGATQMDWYQIIGIGFIVTTIGRRLVLDMVESIRSMSGAFTKAGQKAGYGILSGIETALRSGLPSIFSKISNTTLGQKIFKNGNPITNLRQSVASRVLYDPRMSSAAFNQITNLGKSPSDINSMANVVAQRREFLKLQLQGVKLTAEQQKAEKSVMSQYKSQNQALKDQRDLKQYLLKVSKLPQQQRAKVINQGIDENVHANVLVNASNELKSAAVTSVSVGITTALLEALSGADFKTSMKNAIVVGLASFMPTLIQSVMKIIWSSLKVLLGSAAGLAAGIIGGLIAIITYGVIQAKQQRKLHEEEVKALGKLSETTKKLREDTEATQKSALKASRNYEKAKENAEKYQKLVGKDFLSEKDQTELGELQSYFIEINPDLEDEIKNGTVDIQKVLEGIEENTKKEESYAEQKTSYAIAETRNRLQNFNDTIGEGKYNSLMYTVKSQYESMSDTRIDTKKILMDWYNAFPDVDIQDAFKNNAKAAELYNKGKVDKAIERAIGSLSRDELMQFIEDFYSLYKDTIDDSTEAIKENIFAMSIGTVKASNDAKELMLQSAKRMNIDEQFTKTELSKDDLKAFKKGIVPRAYSKLFSENNININDLMKGGKLLKFDDITNEDTKERIGAMIGSTEWNKLIGESGNNIEDGLEALVTGLKGFSDITQNFLDKAQYYEQIVDIINDDSLTTEEMEKQLKDIVNKHNLDINLEEGDNLWATYKKNVKYLCELGIEKAAELTPRVAKSIINRLDEADFEGSKEIIAQGIAAAAEELGGQYGLIADIPLDNLATVSVAESKNYIRTLVDAGATVEEATRVFWKYIGAMRNRTASVLTNGNQWDVMQEDIDSYFETYVANLELIQKAQDDMQKKGHVSTTNIKQMRKANIDKQFLNNVMLNSDAVGQYATEVTLPSELIKWTLASQEEYIKSVSAYKDDLFNEWLEAYKLDPEAFVENTELPAQILEDIKAAADSGAKSLEEFKKKLRETTDDGYRYLINVQKEELVLQREMVENNIDNIDKLEKEIQKLEKTIHSNERNINKLNRQIRDAQEEYDAARVGSGDFRSSIDGLVNYTNKMNELERAIERVNKALEETTEQSESDSLISELRGSLVNKAGLIQAETKVLENAMSNIASNLSAEFQDVFSIDEKGFMNVDLGAFEALRMSDNFKKDGGEELFNQYNQYYEQREALNDEAKEVLKAFKEYQQQYLDAIVSAQNEVASILENQNEEEVDNLRKKYEAMEEADNKYLDALEKAVDKQRKLRDLENSYDDLATKRKKLSLLQRDTSGATQKDVLSLSKEIKQSEESILDKEVDNLISDLRELAETEKETRDAEIEYQEALKDTVNWLLQAKDVMSQWTSVEDARAWRLSDTKFDELTPEQQEQELLKVEDLYKSYINYLSSSKVDWQTNMQEIADKETQYYQNTFENIHNIGDAVISSAIKKRDKELLDTEEKLEDLKISLADAEEELQENIKDLKEKEIELANLRKASDEQYLSTLHNMTETAKNSTLEVSTFAFQQIAELMKINFSDLYDGNGNLNTESESYKFLEENGQITNGVLSHSGSMIVRGQDVESWGIVDENGNLMKLGSGYNADEYGYYPNEYQAAADFSKLMASSQGKFKGKLKKFAKGGLINYTGPAWVDGSTSKPESFLSADDTFRIGRAAEILASLPFFNRPTDSISTNIGDTSIEIHLNIDKLASDYDVDSMLERVKENIIKIAKPIGSSVILSK